jgi:rubredoxin
MKAHTSSGEEIFRMNYEGKSKKRESKNWHQKDYRSCRRCGIILKNRFEKLFDRNLHTFRMNKIKYCPECNFQFRDK